MIGERSRPGSPGIAIVMVSLLLLVAGVVVGEDTPELAVHVRVLQHQKVDDAVQLVYRLLSDDGTVELRPGGSSLVIRDTSEAIERIVPVLDDFDHPVRAVRLQLQIVRAGGERSAGESPEPLEELDEEVSTRLRQLLRYDRFALLSQGLVTAREGEEVGLQLGDRYSVSFRLGTIMADERLKLQGFHLDRRPTEGTSGEPADGRSARLVHTHLNLWLGEPMVLGLSRAEASDNALMVIVTATREAGSLAVAARGEG